MPRQIPIISDWSELERLKLVQKWHPNALVSRSRSLDTTMSNGSDQECWYVIISDSDTGAGKNTHSFRLTVEACRQELGPRV